MAVIDDIKSFGEQIKSAGPTEEHRQKFGQTLLGTLLGQTVVFVLMMLTYVAVLVLLWKYLSDDLRKLHTELGTIAFWAIVIAPLGCILLFSMLPTAWRALRERRLKAAEIRHEQ